MQIIVYAKPRSVEEDFPGHIVIGQKRDMDSSYYSFRYDLASLPDECLSSGDVLVNYLFSHATPGVIVDETNFVRARQAQPEQSYWKFTDWDGDIYDYLPIPPETAIIPFATYSFNPDEFHSETQPCSIV
jgi:hypothetical protein